MRSLATDVSLGGPPASFQLLKFGQQKLFDTSQHLLNKVWLYTCFKKKSPTPKKHQDQQTVASYSQIWCFIKRDPTVHRTKAPWNGPGGIRWFIREWRKNSVGATNRLQSNRISTNIMDLMRPFTKIYYSNHRWCWTKGTNKWWNVVQQKVQSQNSIWKCGAMLVKNIRWDQLIVLVSWNFLVILQIFFVEIRCFFCIFLHSLEIILTWFWNHFRFSIAKRSPKTPSCYPLVSTLVSRAPAFYMLVSRYLSKKIHTLRSPRLCHRHHHKHSILQRRTPNPEILWEFQKRDGILIIMVYL